jgi:hypothetical protein
LVIILLLYCACAFTLILNLLAEEGIGNANDNEGEDEDKNGDNDDDDDDDNKDEDDNNNKMGQIPAAGHPGAAGRAAHARCSPPRPAVAPAAAAAANVDQLVANFAHAELDLLSFNFQARYPYVFIPTPPLTSGQATVIGYWLVPSVDQTRFSVEVSTKGTHRIFLINIPRQFADLNLHVFLKVNQVVDQDASAIAAGFCKMQDMIIACLPTLQTSAQLDRLMSSPFPVSRIQCSFIFCFRETNFYQVSCRQMVTTTTSISLLCVLCFKQRTYFATETTTRVLK